MEMVRKKQIRIRRAMAARKIKFDGVSKPSHLEIVSMSCGKIAKIINTIGRENQAIEWRTSSRFLVRQKVINISNIIAATSISIWMLVIFPP